MTDCTIKVYHHYAYLSSYTRRYCKHYTQIIMTLSRVRSIETHGLNVRNTLTLIYFIHLLVLSLLSWV